MASPTSESGFRIALFERSSDALFVLNRRRQIRYVNPAFEALAGYPASEVLGLVCVKRRRPEVSPLLPLSLTLAPPSEALRGGRHTLRRAVPPARLGPPWWDITWLALHEGEAVGGVLGSIARVGEHPPDGMRGISEAFSGVREKHREEYRSLPIDGDSLAVDRLREMVHQCAGNTSAVWIGGPPGSGRKTIARMIHDRGIGRENPYVEIDCEAMPAFLIHNQLFGPSGQLESGRASTVCLREPAFLNDGLQADIVQWFEIPSRPVRRIVVSSEAPESGINRRLSRAFVATSAISILAVPPLAERDPRSILVRMLDRLRDAGHSCEAFPPELLDALAGLDWPGELREMSVVLRETIRAADDRPVAREHLPHAVRQRLIHGSVPPPAPSMPVPLLHPTLAAVEKRLLRLALKAARGNRTEAATLLGVSRAEFWRRAKDAGLEE